MSPKEQRPIVVPWATDFGLEEVDTIPANEWWYSFDPRSNRRKLPVSHGMYHTAK